MAFDRERVFFADIIVKTQGSRAVEKLRESARRKFAEYDIDPLGVAQIYIEARDIGYVAVKYDAAVYRFVAFESERVDLLSEQIFKP